MTAQTTLPAKKRFFCNTCRTATNHIRIFTHKRNVEFDEDSGWYAEEVYSLWGCAGCDSATLEKVYTDASLYGKDGNAVYINYGLFPKSSERSVDGKRFKQLPVQLDRIYRETLMAFNDDMDILCGAGLRTLIEGICADKKITGRTLEKQIDNLNSLLPQNIVSNLHGFRFIGNTALHELTPPKKDDLRLAIEVSEDLLNFLYELDYKASRLRKAAQSKQPPKPPQSA